MLGAGCERHHVGCIAPFPRGCIAPCYGLPMTTSTVIAEDAPLGVQIWPTISPDYAPNFTLHTVAVIRGETQTYVEWTYQNGKTRQFRLGEEVAVQAAAELLEGVAV